MKLKLKNRALNKLFNVADSYSAKILTEILNADDNSLNKTGCQLMFIASSERQLQQCSHNLAFFGNELKILKFPAWDCLPYDRSSPNLNLSARRAASLGNLLIKDEIPTIILTTINAVSQRVVPKDILRGRFFEVKCSDCIVLGEFTNFFVQNGFQRVETVRQAGEFAVRGGIVDVFPSDHINPLRLDFFGDVVEKIRVFDAMSQKTIGLSDGFILYPAGEVILNDKTSSTFKQNYREKFGAKATSDLLYASICENAKFQGYEHWLPFFYEKLETIFDYIEDDTKIVFPSEIKPAFQARGDEIADYYTNRISALGAKNTDETIYRPVDPATMFLSKSEFDKKIQSKTVIELTDNNMPDEFGINVGARQSGALLKNENLRETKLTQHKNTYKNSPFDNLKRYIKNEKRPVLIACLTMGVLSRIVQMLNDYGFSTTEVKKFSHALKLKTLGIAILNIESGFETEKIVVFSQMDVFGERFSQTKTKFKRADNFLTEINSIKLGDKLVHLKFGIGRYLGIEAVRVSGQDHDCLKLEYAGGDNLLVAVENMDMLSRYGSGDKIGTLDRLGGAGWQLRKAKIEKKIGIIADKLIETASARALKKGKKLPIMDYAYNEFIAKFEFEPTVDQKNAIIQVEKDLEKGIPMDRLICGDVGFGKTEIALRAAFIAVMNSAQVAIVCPTTLLARQHYQTFSKRFEGFAVNVVHMSRLVKPRHIKLAKQGLKDGIVDIVIGTHGVFAPSTVYKDLGLMIVDEEQHFGVKQKETLKALKKDVHVLSLSATPIPRTLQMALSGVKEMSIIASPPVDRLAIRTFVMPYDGVVIKEAIMREKFRGGQIFYVAPRISDLAELGEKLKTLVPDISFVIAHGGVEPAKLDRIMADFSDNKFDLLLATNIIESGIDISSANTMIIHKADMFGLSQIYQLRGRIGRARVRAFCYLTTRVGCVLSENSKKRLNVIQTLDNLGAGFQIASSDLDIRGAGNILGSEQSGQIKEVGVELYQQMLEDAINQKTQNRHKKINIQKNIKTDNMKKGDIDQLADELDKIDHVEVYSPLISIGMAISIPSGYISDLSERLNFYRRLGGVKNSEQMDSVVMELVDRFGKIPHELENLLKIIDLKILCKSLNIETIEAGDKGALVGFYKGKFSKPEKLINYIQSGNNIRLRPDNKIVFIKNLKTARTRFDYCKQILNDFANL